MPIIPQTLSIKNLRTTNAKSMNMHVLRKLIEYSLKNLLLKAMFTIAVFGIFLLKDRSVVSPAQQCTGNEEWNKNETNN